jgi:hypothetical protein
MAYKNTLCALRFAIIASTLLALALLVVPRAAHAHDAFDAVRCGADVRHALIGRPATDETVARIEARHRAQGLKDLGGDQVTNDVAFSVWRICGREYAVLRDTHIRDVLAVPLHALKTPEAITSECALDGRELSDDFITILHNPTAKRGLHYGWRDEAMLRVKAAWRVDGALKRFVPVSVRGLRCPRRWIITTDGGEDGVPSIGWDGKPRS